MGARYDGAFIHLYYDRLPCHGSGSDESGYRLRGGLDLLSVYVYLHVSIMPYL